MGRQGNIIAHMSSAGTRTVGSGDAPSEFAAREAANEIAERIEAKPRGARWHVSSVANLLARAQKLEAIR